MFFAVGVPSAPAPSAPDPSAPGCTDIKDSEKNGKEEGHRILPERFRMQRFNELLGIPRVLRKAGQATGEKVEPGKSVGGFQSPIRANPDPREQILSKGTGRCRRPWGR
eukprot:gene11798-biopygen1153